MAGRVETGVVQVGDDWPAVLIRGDQALHLGLTIRAVAERVRGRGLEPNLEVVMLGELESLADLCMSMDVARGPTPTMLRRA